MQLNSIKDVLIFWRERQPSKSLSWFANRVGVSPSTIQRIMDGETKNPEFSTARSICLNALEQSEAFSCLTQLFPEKTEYIKSDSKSFRIVRQTENDAVLEAFKDYYKWQMLCLTSIKAMHFKQVEELGRVYSKKSRELVDEGLLVNRENNLTCELTFGHLINPKVLLDSASHITRALVEKFDRGEADQNGHIYFDIDGLSETGKLEAKRAILECCDKLANLKKTNANIGNTPVAVLLTISDLI